VNGGSWQSTSYDSTSGYYEATLDTTGVSDGSTTLNARATDSSSNIATDSISVTVSNGVSGAKMYVWDISWATAGPHIKGTITIQYDSDNDGVAESGDSPVSGASVGYTISVDSDSDGNYDDGSISPTGTTDTSGQVSFMWKNPPSGSYKGSVTTLTHNSYTWDPNLDADNPDYYS